MMRFDSARSSRASSAVSSSGPASDTKLLKKPHTGVTRRAISEEFQPLIKEFFSKEPCPYNHQVFLYGAQMFDVLKHHHKDHSFLHRRGKKEAAAKPKAEDVPNIDFKSANEKRLTFQLVFQALKYQRFLEDMLYDCSFFQQYPEFKEDSSLVMVVLCDFKQRKFQRRFPLPANQTNAFICQIEEALFFCRTKLNAALARSRIKARVLSIDHLLPVSVRQNEKIGSNMHVFGWVNFIKTSVETVRRQLQDEDFMEVQTEARLTGKSFWIDNQCTDMFVFPYDIRDSIETHQLVEEGHLVLQDKSSSVGPHSVRALINEGDDILHVHIGTGITTAHIASLTHNSDTMIYAVGINSEKQYSQIQSNLERLGAKSRVKLIQETFTEVEHHDERLKHIKVVLLSTECSRSGVANPVNFIVSEEEETTILRDLSLGYTDDNKLGELVVKHNTTLKHALRYPRVQAVVYITRSLLEAENENVVTRSIEYVNMVQQKKTPYRIAPPVVPLSDRDIEMENPLNGKYLRYPPSNFMSGCFVATITREADDPKEAAKDILAKAAARGIISGVQVHKDEKPSKSKSKSGRRRDKGDRSSKTASRKKSPNRSKSLNQKDGSPGRHTVGRHYLSSSKRTLSAPGMFSMGVNGSDNAVYAWIRPRPPTPPHEKVIRHPQPFR